MPDPDLHGQRRRLGTGRQQGGDLLLDLVAQGLDLRQVLRHQATTSRAPAHCAACLPVAPRRLLGHQIVAHADKLAQPRQIWLIRGGPAQLGMMQGGEAGQQLGIGAVGLVPPQQALAKGRDLGRVDHATGSSASSNAASSGW